MSRMKKKRKGAEVDLIMQKTDMGNPLFKSSEGDRFDILRVLEDVTEGEVQQVSGMKVLDRLKVYPAASPTRRRGKKSLLLRRDATPEAFPSGSPMSIW